MRAHEALVAVGDVLGGRGAAGLAPSGSRPPPAVAALSASSRAFMAATMATMFGSGVPSAATPDGGVVMIRVTSVAMLAWRSLTLVARTGSTIAGDELRGHLSWRHPRPRS